MANLFGEEESEESSTTTTTATENPTRAEYDLGISVQPFMGDSFGVRPVTGPVSEPNPSSSQEGRNLFATTFPNAGEPIQRGATPAERGKGWSYVAVETYDQRKVAQITFNALVAGSTNNPFATNELLKEAELLPGAAEMAYQMNGQRSLWRYNDPDGENPLAVEDAELFQTGLSLLKQNPEWMGQFAETYWDNMITALTSHYESDAATADRRKDLESHDTMVRFHNIFRSEFSPEEWDLFYSVMATVPYADELLEAKGIDPDPSNIFGVWWRNAQMLVKAPEAIRPYVNDTRTQILNLAESYWRNTDPTDPKARVDFFNYVMSHANASVKDVGRIQNNGFFALAAGTVDVIPTVALNAGSDASLAVRTVMPWGGGPSEWESRNGLTWGQNAALGVGFNAADTAFHDVSGTFDATAQIWADPQNLLFGAAAASKAAKTAPLVASRSDTVLAALNPFSRSAQGLLPLHKMDTSLSARLFYSVMAKDADTLLQSRHMTKHWEWLAKTPSRTRIARRYPDLPPNMLIGLEEARTVDEAREVWRYGMHGDEVLSEPMQAVVRRLEADQIDSRNTYRAARKALIDAEGDNFNINALGLDDGLDPTRHVYEFDQTFKGTGPNPDIDVVADFQGTPVQSNLFGPEIEMGEQVLKNGETVNWFQQMTNDGAMYTFARNTDGDIVHARRVGENGFAGSNTVPNYRRQGLFSEGLNRAGATIEDMRGQIISDDAAPALNRHFGLTGVLRRSQLAEDGGKKTVLASLDGPVRQTVLNKRDEMGRFTAWLDQQGQKQLADMFAEGIRFEDLTIDEVAWLHAYADARGVDVVSYFDEAVVNPNSSLEMISGVDAPIRREQMLVNRLPDEYYNFAKSKIARQFNNKAVNGDVWVIEDLPSWKLSRHIYDFGAWTGKKLPEKWTQALRRTGFVMRHKYPENINMLSAAQGADEMKKWSNMMGLSDEWADPWMRKFEAADLVSRKGVLDDWLKAAGDELGQPWLKYNLYSRVRKGGEQSFEHGAGGEAIGKLDDGSVMPMTISNMAQTYMMPDAAELQRSLRRYRQRSPLRLHRGMRLTGTRKRRAEGLDSLRRRFLAKNPHLELNVLTDEDWARLAYADAFASEMNATRGHGAGMVNKVATAPVKLARGFGSFFSISQLAGRPFAWNSRVLIEESFRDLFMGNFAMLRNPVAYFEKVWDSAAIRRLNYLDLKASESVALLTDELWDAASRSVRADRWHEMFPGVPLTSEITKGDIASFLSKELRGGRNFKPSLAGRRGNAIRSAYRNNRRITAAKSRIAKYDSIDESVRWEIEGAEIANRSFVNNFVTEIGTSTVPLEWNPQAMTTHAIDNFGYAQGRDTLRMLNDSVIGPFGLGRLTDRLLGNETAHTAEKLVSSSRWSEVESLMNRYIAGTGRNPEAMTAVQKADEYLTHVVDNIADNLFRPLIDEMPLDGAAEALKTLRNQRTATVLVGGEEITLNLNSYGDATKTFTEFAEAAALVPGRRMPEKVSGYFDASFMDVSRGNIADKARVWLDREMLFFGETTTQALHRQPAYLTTKEQFYQRFRRMGWDHDTAQAAAGNKAAEITNYVFFDNSSIPQVLHELNKVFPFFSAMFEVGQTWAYKIPMMSRYGFGLAHMVRRIDRTLSGMFRSGLIDYDPESGQMAFVAANDPDNNSNIINAVSRGAYGLMRAPIQIMEWAAGLKTLALEGEYESGDFSAWSKDGFQFTVGNPIDPTSYGLMAVNQFSVGFTPVYQALASHIARATYAWDDEIIDVEPQTLAEFMEANPDLDVGLVMQYNEEAFIEKNGEGTFSEARLRNLSLEDLEMPDAVRLPKTSWWESMLDNTIFPFGKYENGWQAIAAPVPNAVQYMIRGWGMTGQGNSNDWLGNLFGNMSNYQAHAALVTEMQMLEARDGRLSKEREMVEELMAFREANKIELLESGSLTGGTAETRQKHQEMVSAIERYQGETIRRATQNAGGALFSRGILGWLGPVSPRSFAKEQEAIGRYWAGKDLAEEYRQGVGSNNLRSTIQSANISGLDDMVQLAEIANAWLADDTGDGAKVWLKENMPGLQPFLQGKSFYGTVGISPVTESFEDWVNLIESGDIEGVPIEVFAMRHHMASVATDKQFAIVQKYGNNADLATQRILSDQAAYYELVDNFNSKYDSLEWMDEFMYGGAHAAYRNRSGAEAFTLVESFERDAREMAEAQNVLEDMLKYGDLSAEDQRKVLNDFKSTRYAFVEAARQFKETDAYDYLNPLEKNILNYSLEVAEPFYDRRSEKLQEAFDAETGAERDTRYRELRKIDEESLAQRHTIVSAATGKEVVVPPPLIKTWNSKSEDEKREAIYDNLSKPGAWLNSFEIAVMQQQFPNATTYLPNDESRRIHDWFTEQKAIVFDYARQNPERMTPYERTKRVDKLEEQFKLQMQKAGRAAELEYEDATPFEQMRMMGALPDTLIPAAERLNTIYAGLRAQDKSPRTNEGRIKIIQFVDNWLTPYFEKTPQAKIDFMQLGNLMYGEDSLDALYGIFLQGRIPISLKLS